MNNSTGQDLNGPGDYLPEESITEQEALLKASPATPDTMADAIKRANAGLSSRDSQDSQYGATGSAGGAIPLKINLANALVLENDQPLEVATRLGTFTVPLWLTAEVMTEISNRHNSIENLPAAARPPDWTLTGWWGEVREYLQANGMPAGISDRELLLFWKHLWATVKSLGKAYAPGA